MSFTLSADGAAITCDTCKLTSHHPDDVVAHYCGHCHVFHDDEARPCEACGKLLVRIHVRGHPAKLPRRCAECQD